MLAQRMRRVRSLKRFLYVSTAYLCGSPAPALVRENDFPRPDSRHVAEYTRSKAESELLRDAIADDLPWVIARPSAVVGHTSFGCRPSASIFWYYRHLHLVRWLPVAAERRKDIVPVDYVAEALWLLLLRTELKHRRYHISAGEGASATWAEIMAAFDVADGIDSAGPFAVGGNMPILCADGGRDPLLGRATECFVAFSQCGVEVFENQRLLGEGMPPPQRFPNYLGRCLESVRGRTVNEMLRDDL